MLCQSFLRLGLVDEIGLSIIRSYWVTGYACFDNSGIESGWHLKNAVAYRTGIVESLYRSQSTNSQP
jgi:dihydrofolate reductase